ncbi:MAG: TRAP transporter large permease [Clostridiales Family XIII bacterium]|jgi:tripartite ATP-independent transporter DctM subunit|nr:TRAP transporter large permease [Clostridiales Family XIII bacterium]
MSPEIIGLLAIVALIVLIALRMWIGVAMGVVGLVGLIILRGMDQALMMAAEVPFTNINSYTLTVIPMFALMGMVISESSIGTDLFKACNAWLGSVRGGLSAATVATSGLLGAICGSHMVGTVILSKIALPEMKRYKYDGSFAAATVCAGAPLSIIIPPSLPLIVYGIITEQSIGKLFMSGIIPGVVMICVFIAIIVVRCTQRPELGPRGASMPFAERLKSSKGIIPVVILFVAVLGGIYFGIFTTTESGAIGSAGAIIISICYRSMNGRKFLLAIKETAMIIGMIFSLLLGTYIFIRFISYSKIPFVVSEFLVNLDAPLPLLMLALALIYIVLGMLIPEIPMIILTIPILYPALMSVGFDPIWLGIFVVLMMALGAVTPPIGMVVFIVSGLSGVSVPTLFKAVMPFIIGDLCVIVLVCIFPQMATWLPSLMYAN